MVGEFVPVFAHAKLTSDAFNGIASRYFEGGKINVPIVLFLDPAGREIPGTRLNHQEAQVKATYLERARKALADFRGGQPAEKVRESWKALGAALRLRKAGGDPGAAVEDLVALRDGAPKGSPLRASLEDLLGRIDREEAAGLVDVAKMDLGGDDPDGAVAVLFQVLREFPGLPSAATAKSLLDRTAADPARKEAWTAAEREHRAWLALRAADRLDRAGKGKEATEAWARVAADFPGTPAAEEAGSRKAR